MLTAAQLIRPGEERWDSARAAWNLAIRDVYSRAPRHGIPHGSAPSSRSW